MRQDITLDVRKRETSFGRAKLLPLRRGEKGNRELVVSIEEDGRAYDLAGKTASLVATTAAGKLVGPCPMEVAEAGIARIMLPAALYSAVRAFTGYVEIREGETLVDTTDSFGGKVIECADLDSEQAEEFTPLLGELQNAVAEEAKRVEAEKARAQAETERATGFAEAKQASQAATKAANDAAEGANLAASSASTAAKSANTAAGKATNAAAKAESDVRAFVNAAGTAVGDAIAGAKADVDAAVKRSDAATAKAEDATKTADAANTAANQAVTDAQAAIAEVKATEAKLYPAAENILVGSDSGVVAHVDDAFNGATLRKITVEGAAKQVTTTGKNIVKLDEAKETLRGLELDVKSSGQVVINGAAKSELWDKIGTVDVVAGKTYVLSLNKAYPTIGVSAWSDSDSKHVLFAYAGRQTDTSTATKTETLSIYISGGNGSTFNKEVVSIQIEEGTSKTDWEPYTGGKSSPSPEYQQPIAVVEHPTVKVTGRNVLDFTFPTLQSGYSSGIANITPYSFGKKCISLPYTTMGSSSGFGFVQKLMPGSYTVKAFNAPAKASVNIAAYKAFEDTKNIGSNLWHISEQMLSGIPSFTVTDTAQYVVFCFAAIWENGTNKITYPADFKAVVEYGGTATEYKPYTSQTLTFTLPAEHPYLAKLPDGTADEIVVDEEGNVELVARVARVLPSEQKLIFEQGGDGSASYVSFRFANDSESKKRVMCSSYEATEWTNKSGYIYCPQNSSMVIRDSRFTSEEQARKLLNDVVVYVAVEPTRYPLGKIEMPKAQDSIINVWTDAEVTPRTGIRYVRDVNIVVANLESAIASITQG